MALVWNLIAAILLGWRVHESRAIRQGSVPKDPFDLCRNPYLELRNLTLVALREYKEPGHRVRLLRLLCLPGWDGIGSGIRMCRFLSNQRGWTRE